jgi:phage/conjugal plasmid C-4 type zinc finger TraR family protein
MPDLIDRAQELDVQRGELINQVQPIKAPLSNDPWCWTCGDEIPAKRRAAMPGVPHCVHCVSAAERERKHYARPR